jgi:two-component system, OmpR family, sensor kinase
MSRLFCKFFLSLWLAQIVTVAGVGLAVWSFRGSEADSARFAPPTPDSPPPLAAEQVMDGAPGEPPARPPRGLHLGAPPVLPIFFGSLVSLLFAASLAWYFARPLRTLRDAFKAVAEGRLDVRIGAVMGQRKDELAELGQHFDHMTERLQRLLESQRRLLHDVSHELRSPLARLQAAGDLIQQQPERGAELAVRIQRDISRMDALVGELLTLARIDADSNERPLEHVDLCEVIADIVADARFEIADRHCQIRLELPAALPVLGDHEHLHRALENVVRNAIRFSLAGGSVLIAAQQAKGVLRIRIADNGPGVADSELQSIFEPFVRSAASQGSAGYGLGLAITQRVMRAHGGRAFAVNLAEGGLQVSLELPTKGQA